MIESLEPQRSVEIHKPTPTTLDRERAVVIAADNANLAEPLTLNDGPAAASTGDLAVLEPTRGDRFIHGVATAVPAFVLERAAAAEYLAQSCRDERTATRLRRIMRLSGIEKRHLAALEFQGSLASERSLYQSAVRQPHGPGMGVRTQLFEQCAAPLVQRALAQLDAARLAQVRTLITASCTHASAPGLERPIFAHAPVPRDAQRWNLGFMGCSAALAGLRLAFGQRAAGPTLLLACEISSLHFQYSDDVDQLTANLLFADGAAALLLDAQPGPVRVVACGCETLPDDADHMRWFADDFGLRLHLSAELPAVLSAALPAALERFLAPHTLTIAEIDHWLVHPGGPQVLDAVAEALALPPAGLALSRAVLREFGNMSSPTILFILQRLMASDAGGRAGLLAFGPGLTIEMALLDLSDEACLPACKPPRRSGPT